MPGTAFRVASRGGGSVRTEISASPRRQNASWGNGARFAGLIIQTLEALQLPTFNENLAILLGGEAAMFYQPLLAQGSNVATADPGGPVKLGDCKFIRRNLRFAGAHEDAAVRLRYSDNWHGK